MDEGSDMERVEGPSSPDPEQSSTEHSQNRSAEER